MPSGAPFFYDYANVADSFYSPSEIHLVDNKATAFYSRYLLQKAMSVFKWTLPPMWPENYFLYTLYSWGVVAIIRTDKFGIIPQACSLKGYDVFYQPTNAVIANPLLRGLLEPRIGTQCTIIQLQPNYSGILDIVKYHATLMALAYEALTTNLVNSKLAYVATASSKAEAESFKKLYDQIASGVPAVVQRPNRKNPRSGEEPSFQLFSQNVGPNFIAPEILAAMRTIERAFDREVGIPAPSFEGRKERPIEAELQAGNFETQSRSALWLQLLQKGCRQTREMFGVEISVDWRADNDGNLIDSRTGEMEPANMG